MINYIKNLFSKPKPHTAIHPDYKTLIEKVTTIKGRTLYKFKSLLDMPHNRYNACTRMNTEFNMRIDIDILRTSITDAQKYINEGNITKVAAILTLLEAHTDMILSLKASYRLASCVYFWKDESLDDYDFEIGDEKIKLFKEIGLESFFLTKPMNNFLPPMDISASDLKVFSQYEKELQSLLSRQLKEPKESDTKAI